MNKMLLSAALAGVFAAGVVTTANAQDTAKAAAPSKVKCYGIAKAGKNDCAASNKSHACAGKATKDGDAHDFNLVADKAACDAAKGMTEAPKS